MSTNAIDEERLVRENIKLAYWVVEKLLHRGAFGLHELEDMQQEALIGLMRAARSYDPEQGTGFSTFAARVMQNQIWQVAVKNRRNKRGGGVKTYSLDANAWHANYSDDSERTNVANFVPSEQDVEAETLTSEAAEAMAKLVLLICRERDGKWFLRHAAGESQTAIAGEYGVTKQTVNASLKRSREKLKAEFERLGLNV